MRGKLARHVYRPHTAGLIPAHAGKTRSAFIAFAAGRAHPRACGENHRWGEVSGDVGGSSPRMRGKLHLQVRAHRKRRLIPAHAGKTFDRGWLKPRERAHPRACGENVPPIRGVYEVSGSSPRMRGKLDSLPGGPGPRRLIPAHAGKTRLDTAR